MKRHSPILRIALPSIVSNITVPLLGLVDAAIAGHLGDAVYLAAIALGGMMFNMMYWLFSFLRTGTGGLTAQAYGAHDADECQRMLCRSLVVALVIGLAIITLQEVVLRLTLSLVTADDGVARWAVRYFRLLIWGAPAVMALYSFSGWFLGMQNARFPMVVSIAQNVVNILTSLLLVVVCGWGIDGVAVGTLVAQYAGVAIAFVLYVRRYGFHLWRVGRGPLWADGALRRFFVVNRDIFLRTLCLVAVTTAFTATGTALGGLTLAANALLMQLFILYSYFMDGFAYAGEALGGKYVGGGHRAACLVLTRRLFLVSLWPTAAFTLLYVVGGTAFLGLLTDQSAVLDTAGHYLPAACLIPAVSVAAFLFDGLFVGATATRAMLLSMGGAAAVFFLTLGLLPWGNTTLWIAFLLYLGCRGAMQWFLFRGVVRRAFSVRQSLLTHSGAESE